MSYYFNAEEIFEMAAQIERNGAKFYRRASEAADKPHVRQLLRQLAAMEDEHEKVFIAMKAELSDREKEPTAFDPQDETALYLKAMADANVFNVSDDPSALLTGKETAENIFRTAIGLEKESISFYTGMKYMIPQKQGQARIEAIIKEEMGHAAKLSNELASLTRKPEARE